MFFQQKAQFLTFVFFLSLSNIPGGNMCQQAPSVCAPGTGRSPAPRGDTGTLPFLQLLLLWEDKTVGGGCGGGRRAQYPPPGVETSQEPSRHIYAGRLQQLPHQAISLGENNLSDAG